MLPLGHKAQSAHLAVTATVLLVSVAACDPYWYVVVKAPVARPLPVACLDATIAKLLGVPISPPQVETNTTAKLPYTEGSRGTLFPLSQHREKDGSARLELSVRRFGHAFQDSRAITSG